MQEHPIVFDCGGDQLVGILHPGMPHAECGVIVVVGGPQYRVGSHRQFVIMARRIAAAGFPVLRFDYRGMGDSEGLARSFDNVDDDIRAAVNCFTKALPDLKGVALLGLCDAASANLIYCNSDERVRGLILLNPWVRTTQGQAKSYLRHYYLQRFLQGSFWRKVLTGQLLATKSLREFIQSLRDARADGSSKGGSTQANQSFISRMLRGLKGFRGNTLFVISGRDLTAQEFMDLTRSSQAWKDCLRSPKVSIKELPAADHTMSSSSTLSETCFICTSWLESAFPVSIKSS